MRARLYSSWASSTWSLPSALPAWAAKMSRITVVRSTTGSPSASSRLRSWRAVSSSSQAIRFASQAGGCCLRLGDLAGAEVGVRVRVLAALHELADDGHAGRAQQLAELREVIALRQGRDAEGALARALPGLEPFDRASSEVSGDGAAAVATLCIHL